MIINAYSLALLLIIYVQNRTHADRTAVNSIIFHRILLITAILLVLDSLSRFDGHPGTIYPLLNAAGNFLIFLCSPLLPALWLVYACYQSNYDEERIKRLFWPLGAVLAANGLLLAASLSRGWLYTIDSANIYHRGPLYWLPVSITLVLLLTGEGIIAFNRKRIEHRHFVALMLFIVPPLLCILLQILFYGLSLMLNSVVISLLIVFYNLQNRSIHTDYLTGINNRKRLDTYMTARINASTARRTFAAILLDIDNFKQINDTFGHDAGDEALTIAANLLKSCLRANDLVARFGGDEFYIILDVSTPQNLEVAVSRINQSIAKYNKISTKPYQISFSMGYAVYDYQAHPKLEAFQKQLDIMMYANKRANQDRS